MLLIPEQDWFAFLALPAACRAVNPPEPSFLYVGRRKGIIATQGPSHGQGKLLLESSKSGEGLSLASPIGRYTGVRWVGIIAPPHKEVKAKFKGISNLYIGTALGDKIIGGV